MSYNCVIASASEAIQKICHAALVAASPCYGMRPRNECGVKKLDCFASALLAMTANLPLIPLDRLHHVLGAQSGDNVLQVAGILDFNIHQQFKEVGITVDDFEVIDVA